VEFWLFDYRYVTGSGKNAHAHRQTVVAFPNLGGGVSPGGGNGGFGPSRGLKPAARGVHLPAFELCRENIFHKIGKVFGFRDIDFPEHPSFSKRYLLRGEDEPAVRAIFDAGLMNSFDHTREINVEAGGNCLIVYRASRRVKPADLLAFLDEAAGVRDAIVDRAGRAHRQPPPAAKPPALI